LPVPASFPKRRVLVKDVPQAGCDVRSHDSADIDPVVTVSAEYAVLLSADQSHSEPAGEILSAAKDLGSQPRKVCRQIIMEYDCPTGPYLLDHSPGWHRGWARSVAEASTEGAAPLAIVAAPTISTSVAKSLQDFLAENAPDTAAAIFDREGCRVFLGPGLEKLNGPAPSRVRRKQHVPLESSYLFSDLNQWMLKVLLAPLISADLLRAPRRKYRNASELAEAAEVSVMSAFRLVRQLRKEGFLDADDEILRLVRREQLMRLWQAAYMRPVSELPVRWIIPVRNSRQLPAALHSYTEYLNVKHNPAPRFCLGLFAAAEQLGFGFVHGVPPSFYLENLDREVLARLGLSREGAQHAPDVL
jgi:hypothetical protein